ELLVVQSEDLSGAGGRRDHGVSHVIVATIAHGCVPGEFALYLVARPHGFDELSTRGVDVFATGDQAPDVVARMWRLARREKRVHEVEIAREARVVRRRTGRAGAPVRPPETGRIAAGSLFDRFADAFGRVGPERTDRDAHGVEHALFQLLAHVLGEVVVGDVCDEIGQFLGGRHT